jgi:hypothetical protein
MHGPLAHGDLEQAQAIGALWPLTADRYVTTRALHDPTGWLAGWLAGWLRTLHDESVRAPPRRRRDQRFWC